MPENIGHATPGLIRLPFGVAHQTERGRVPGSLRRSTIMTATFAALQNLSCTEARQGLSDLRQVSNPIK
jgi:hypothetical protein